MDLVTVYNYSDEDNYYYMFKIWLNLAIKCKEETPKLNRILIICESLSDRIEKHVKEINKDYIVVIKGRYYPDPVNVNSKWNHNVYFKFYNICLLDKPFIYVDADAFITTNLTEAIESSKDKPFICVDHQTIPGHTDRIPFKFLNGGFMIVSDPSFFDFEKMYKTQYVHKCPGTDQMILFNYCRTIGYDYTHPNIHFGYNSCSAFMKVLDDGRIVSDGIPEEHDVYIVHYWFHYKPWIRCPCCVRGDRTCDLYSRWLIEVQ